MIKYELNDADLELIRKLLDAVEYYNNGDPIKDVLDEDDFIEAVLLLVAIIDSEDNS